MNGKVDTQTSHAGGSGLNNNAKNNNNVNGLHNGLSSKQKQEEAEDLKIDGFKVPCEEELSEDDEGEDSEGRSMTTRKRKHHQISGYL